MTPSAENPVFRDMHSVPVRYSAVRDEIPSGAILLRRAGPWLSSRLIGLSTGTPYCHAAMAGWWGNVLLCLETLQFHGGRAVTLSSQVRRYPGKWDVYEARPSMLGLSFNGHQAIQVMIRGTGEPYGWRSLLAAAWRRALRMPLTDDNLNGSWPICSQLVSRACRAGGRDPRPGMADCVTEPGHLADPAFAAYRYTLYETREQVRLAEAA